jgi:prohibitin 1
MASIQTVTSDPTQAQVIKYVITGFVILFVLIFVVAFFPLVVVGAGQRGIVFNNVTGIENRILGEGIHVRFPFLQHVTKVSVRVQKTEVHAEAASKDLQTVNTDVVINWHMDAGKVNTIFQAVGDEEAVEDRILAPAVNEVVKAATAQKTASEILAKRAELKRDIDTALQIRLRKYNLILNDVSIVNVRFTPEFNRAIENKQIAQQQAEQAKFLVEKARSEAEANSIKQQSITPEILQQRALEKWDGHFPQYWGNNSPLPFINISPTQ